MSGSKYEYVRAYERPDGLLANTFLLLRIDGHAFHKFSDKHGFRKPNDERALKLMDRAAQSLMDEYPDIVLGFGESDEYSFLIRRKSNLYSRRESKLVSLLVSLFTSAFVYHWSTYFPPPPSPPAASTTSSGGNTLDYPASFELLADSVQPPTAADAGRLLYPPSFDGRVVCYPSEKEVRDYFAWRQVDTHINNLYNTTFWALILLPPLPGTGSFGESDAPEPICLTENVNDAFSETTAAASSRSILSGSQMTTTAAHKVLQGSFSKDKHELLWARGVSYGRLGEREKKGSILVREEVAPDAPTAALASLALDSDEQAPSIQTTPDTSSPQSDLKPSEPPLPAHWTNRKLQPKRGKNRQPDLPFDGTSGQVVVLHVDLIKDAFWEERPWLLA